MRNMLKKFRDRDLQNIHNSGSGIIRADGTQLRDSQSGSGCYTINSWCNCWWWNDIISFNLLDMHLLMV